LKGGEKMIAFIKSQVMEFMKEEDGVGVIEIVLILVVLIGLVIIFKDAINEVLEDTLNQIKAQSGNVY
jgi:Flp pilus assembly pilin Flp